MGIAHNEGVYSDNVGDTHLWGVWHGLQPMQYYRKRMTRFCSEFGFESLPDAKAIRQYAKPGDYALNSPVFNLHQKCASVTTRWCIILLLVSICPGGFGIISICPR